MQAGSIIQNPIDGLDCNETAIFDLAQITDPGDCANVSYSIFGDIPSGLNVSLVGTTLTIENDDTTNTSGEPFPDYLTVQYKINCEDDIRAAVGFIQVYIKEACVDEALIP